MRSSNHATVPSTVRAALLRDAVMVSGERVRSVHFLIFPVALTLGVFLWNEVGLLRLLVPLLFIVLVTVRGLALSRQFARLADTPRAIAIFAQRFRTGIVLYGCALGAIGTALLVPNDLVLQLPVLLVIVGMAAGGITTQVGFPRAMHLFHALAFGPLVARLLIDGSRLSIALASILLAYGIGLSMVGRSGARAFRQQSLLKIEKSALADELRLARDELAKANDVLDERIQDVTERLAQANQLASLGRLASGVAHEINNPLSWVVSNAEYVREGLERAVMERSVKLELLGATDDIVLGGSRVAAIVKDLSSLANNDKACDPVDFHVLLRRCVRVANKLTGDRAAIELELDAEAPTVLGNATRLSQLVLNLLMNASEAIRISEEGGGQISIRTRSVDGNLHLEIADTGGGIKATDIDLVFEPFFTTKRAGEGCGLGLSICRNIAVQHGGSIAAKTSDRGATFSVRLPLEPQEAPASAVSFIQTAV